MTNKTAATTDLIRPQRVPDILDVIAALSSDAVPTPPLLARALLDILPDEVWSNPNYKWLDPATKSGSILREIARRLMLGLTEWEPAPTKRAEHILRNMLYGCGITQVHGDMSSAASPVRWCINQPQDVVLGGQHRSSHDRGSAPAGRGCPSGGVFLSEQLGLLDDERDR